MLTGGALDRRVGFELDVWTAEDRTKENRRRHQRRQKESRVHGEEADRQADEHASKAERGAVPTNPFQSRGERDYSDERQTAASRGRRAYQLDRKGQAQRADEH